MKNFRDFGYGNIKKGLLFRGESLFKLSKKDERTLVNEHHLKVVVDLRTNQEHESDKDKIIPGVEYYHLPLITMEEMGASSEEEGKENASSRQQLPDMFTYYRKLVSPERKEHWTQIFNLLLEDEEKPIYFHCTVGKDRTGVVAAMILSALGIDKETIYKDYLLTNEHPIIPFKYKLFSLKLKKPVRKQFFELFLVKTDYLDAAFGEIKEDYGSIDGFFKECCSLDEEKIKKLRKKYLLD